MELEHFHPTVAGWFRRRFGEPTEAQRQGWPAIRARHHTLIAAPTGSGKTLAAFFSAIDDLVRQALESGLPTQTQVLYISPLKALGNDIQRNLQEPLAGIRQALEDQGLPPAEIRVVVRSGDTPAAERAAMIRRPPHILVTTPESLYLLLTSPRGREILRPVRTVIVDEIHALVGSKRGSHLALSLERLQHLVSGPLVRVGLSATQRPIETVARFLVGAGDGKHAAHCTVVDTGHVRPRDLAVEVPASPLEAVMSGEVWQEVYTRLAALILSHRTTLVFVNTRRLAERLARHLSERLGEDAVTAHHGSMSKEHRLDAEQRLKAGKLKALVATASLELGIDVGAVDLVCQIGSTKSIAAFLQRVGRSGHTLHGTPKGRLFPLTRDELVECAALLDSVRRGELDRLVIPEKPLDVLAQQIVAAVACDEWRSDDLYHLFRRAYPYGDLERSKFDAVVDMLSRGFTSRRGRSAAYVHHDAVNGRLRARRGARPTAVQNGGAIPETAAYDVVLEPSGILVGTVEEDFAVESLPGDVFQLGNASWRIARLEPGRVRVEDAQGQPPNIPFWFGEVPGRSDELSVALSRLREEADARLLEHPFPAAREPAGRPAPLCSPSPADPTGLSAEDGPGATDTPSGPEDHPVVHWLVKDIGLPPAGAVQVAEYLASARAALGALPSQHTLIAERFFDESGAMQLVVHSPFGSRINRAWGLALRKRFCRQFNFELQAAANEDAIILSLGPTHSFPLAEVFHYLNSRTVREVLIQALLDAPMFAVRWRHNANRALAVPRRLGGRKVAPQLQRMRAQDLLALVFPDQQACLENIAGDREVPDHPLVNQTLRDCLEEVMDLPGLVRLLDAMADKRVVTVACDLREPSPMAAEILNARPYAFLDNAPLEERRTQAVAGRRWLDPETAASLGALDAAAITRVRAEAWPEVNNADELHDALMQLGMLTGTEGMGSNGGPSPETDRQPGWRHGLAELVDQGRATAMLPAPGRERWWVAAEWLPVLLTLFPDARLDPVLPPPPALTVRSWTREEALKELLRARLEAAGPVTARAMAELLALSLGEVEGGLTALEAEGFVFRGLYSPGAEEEEWCERGLLARIHRYTLHKLRREIEPVPSADFMRFLFAWQRVGANHQVDGLEALAGLIEQLEGFEAPATAWERELLAARMVSYDAQWLDRLCAMGSVAWARLSPGGAVTGPGRRAGPVATTPITLLNRRHLPHWENLSASRNGERNSDTQPQRTLTGSAAKVAAYLSQRGASFFSDLVAGTGLLPTQVEAALGELVSEGCVTSDSFSGLRALLLPARKRPSPRRWGGALLSSSAEGAGRWSLLADKQPVTPAVNPEAAGGQMHRSRPVLEPQAVEMAAWVLLRRYGVVFRRLLEREQNVPPWRDLVRTYRRLEARGEIRGGRFVAGMSGEQYALPEAVGSLRETKRQEHTGALISVSGADPVNLVGIITPGRRVHAVTANRVLYREGIPVAALEAGTVSFWVEPHPSEHWMLKNALLGHNVTPLPLGSGAPGSV